MLILKFEIWELTQLGVIEVKKGVFVANGVQGFLVRFLLWVYMVADETYPIQLLLTFVIFEFKNVGSFTWRG